MPQKDNPNQSNIQHRNLMSTPDSPPRCFMAFRFRSAAILLAALCCSLPGPQVFSSDILVVELSDEQDSRLNMEGKVLLNMSAFSQQCLRLSDSLN